MIIQYVLQALLTRLCDYSICIAGSTDESFVERLLLQFSDRNAEDLIKQGPTPVSFILQHFQVNRDSPSTKTIMISSTFFAMFGFG